MINKKVSAFSCFKMSMGFSILPKPKKAAIGEGVMSVFRLLIVMLITLTVLGISAIYYSYSINVADSEAAILNRDIVNCIAPSNVIDLQSIEGKDLLDYCKLNNLKDRAYVEVYFKSLSIGEKTFYGGDSGALWVKDLFDYAQQEVKTSVFGFKITQNEKLISNIAKYKPGYFQAIYSFYVKSGNSRDSVEVIIKSLVRVE